MSAPASEDQIRLHLETLEAAPGDVGSFRALESLYENAARWDDLIALYEGRAQAVPEPGAPLLARAANLARNQLRNTARAEGLWRRVLQAEPAHGDALRAVAEILEEREDWTALAAVLEREAAGAHDPAEAARRTLRAGKVHEERLGRRDRAALLYARACRLDPTLGEARTRALACFVALRRFGQAKKMLDAVRDLGGDRPGLAAEYARLGAALVDEPLEHGLAMDALIEALALDRSAPGAAEARERLKGIPRAWRDEARALDARAAASTDRREAAGLQLKLAQLHVAYDPEGAPRALERIERAWALAPGDGFALELLGRAFAERGDHRGHADALAKLAAGTRDRAAQVALHLEMARVDLVRFGDADAALAALERALELDPACESAALQAFEHHADAGRFDRALGVLERHLSAAPEKPAHAPLRVRSAQLAKDRLSDPARARRHLEAALRVDPGHFPAATALASLLADAGEWQRLAQLLEGALASDVEPAEKVRLLERLAEVQQERLGKPKEALRTLARALALDPARAQTRKAMEGAAARADAFGDLARAYRSAADDAADLKAKKTLLRRVAEIVDRDLGKPEEAVRAWRALLEVDADDRGAQAALDACLAKAGQQEELAKSLDERRRAAAGDERRSLSVKLAKLWQDAARYGDAAGVWREVVEAAPTDDEALWGLHAALEAQSGPRAAEERTGVLAALAARAKGPSERAALELARAELLADPLARPEDAATLAIAVLAAGGIGPGLVADATSLLERLPARGADGLRVAQALVPVYASSNEPAKHAAALELVGRKLPQGADPRERARAFLDASQIRADRLGDLRGALSDAAAALRAAPDHAEARRRCEDLARQVGAQRELYGLLQEAARRLQGRPEEEAALRVRAAAVAEEDLGAYDDAATQLHRALELRPADPAVLAALTRVALASERWQDADALLARRAQAAAGPEKAALLAQRAEVLEDHLKDPAAAAAALREAVEFTPQDGKARLLGRLAAALGAAGDAAGRAKALAALAASVPDKAEASKAALESARIQASLGDPVTAAEALAAAYAANPEDAPTLAALEAVLEGANPEATLAAAGALASHPDPRRRAKALEARARALRDPAERAEARLAAARIHEAELDQVSLAFLDVADAVKDAPADAALRAELRRLAAESQELEACAKVYDELAERAPAEQRLTILRERAEWSDRRRDPASAAEGWQRVLAANPGDREALTALRRLHRARERWGELADVCAEIGRAAQEPATRQDALREEAAVAETRLRDLGRAAAAWTAVAGMAPADAEAQASLERLHEQLDRPRDLAIALERRLARAFDLDTAARLAELRRTRLGDPAGALALHAELVRRDPSRMPSVDALVALAATPGPVGREALAAAEPALAAAGEHARRVAAREARLGAVTEPEERAQLFLDVRTILAHDLADPAGAFAAARRAFGEAGPARAGAGADLERLARATGKLDELAAAWEEAARGAAGAEALDLARRGARLRTERGAGAAAVDAWKRVLDAAPGDGEAMAELEKLYQASRSAGEILVLARHRVGQAEGPARAGHWLHAGKLCEDLGDAAAALEAFRAARAEDPASTPALEGLDRLLARQPASEEHLEVLAALAGLAGPDERLAVLLRRAALLEADPSPRRAVEGYAELLAEWPREPRAVAGLERLLARPDAREPAARALEDVFRAAGDARRLVGLLELRLEHADPAERAPLLAEVAALHERLGDRKKAFLARARELDLAAARGEDAPAVRAELERLAATTGAFGELAAALEAAAGAPGLPPAAALEMKRRLAAVAADRLGRLDAAARWYEDVAREAPTPETLGALSRVYRKLGAHRDLARTLGRLADVAPGASAQKELLLEVAKIMADQLSDRDGAVDAYKKILAVDPEDPNALRLLGKLLNTAERWDELADVLAREVSLADRNPNLAADAAELRYRLGRIRQQRLSDPDGALLAYREVLAKVPRHPGALTALEELARGSGASAIEAAGVLEPVYAAEGEHQKLVETLEARAANETDPVARAALLRRVADVYGGSMRNAELAFVAASRALAAHPDALESLEAAERWSAQAGSAEELAALLAENADRAREPRTRGELLRRIARLARPEPAKAAEAWQRVLDLLPEDAEACHGLVEALRGGQEPEAFAQALRRALAIEPDDARRATLLADLAAVQDERLDDAGGAILTTRRLLELRPEDRDALARLDRLCVRTERWVDLGEVLAREVPAAAAAGDEAAVLALEYRLAELKEARLLDKEGALALYEEVLKARPDHPEAIARLEAWLQRDPGHPRVGFVLEMAYAQGGDAARQAAVLEMRAGERPDAVERKALYLQLADVREQKLADPEMAFLALCKAFREDPADVKVRARLEKSAEASGHEEELCAIYQDEVDRLPPVDAAAVSLVIGRLLDERLSNPSGAAPYLRRAQALDPEAAQFALPALERIYTKLESWPELADVLSSRAAAAAAPADKVAILFRLGQLCEEMLEQKDRAAEAYEHALVADPRHLPSLRALEALYEGAGRKEDLYRNLDAQRAAPGDAAAKERVIVKLAGLAAELGRIDDAVALWRELLTQKPRHDQALAALEELFEQGERWSDLAAHLRIRLSATVDRREIARLNDKLGLVLGTKLGDMGQAVASYKAVLDSDPRNKRALESLRDIYAAQGEQEALAGVYRRLVPLQEDAAGVKRVRLELAEVLLRAGNKREATEQAKLAFDIEPHLAEELVRIEEVFRQTGAGAEGVRAAEARAALLAEQGGPAEAIPAWLAVAELWKGQRRPDAAAAALDKVLELDPGNRSAFDAVRAIHQEAGNWRLYARVSETFAPQVADPAERLGLMKEAAGIQERRLGQKEGAFLAWSRVVAAAPADEEALAACERLAAETEANEELSEIYEQVADESKGIVRAQILLRLGRLRDEKLDDADGAESAFRRALEADPGSPEALASLTHLFKRRGRVRELVITLEQKLEAAADMAEKKATLVEVARLYDGELKDVDEAITALRRVLELDGSDPAALDALTGIYRREARWQDLAGVLSRARDLAATDEHRIAYQLAIASLYENEISDDEAAVEAYRTVLGMDDGSQEALSGLERLYTKLDRFAELNRVYERQVALTSDPVEQAHVLAKERRHPGGEAPRREGGHREERADPVARRRQPPGGEGARAALPRREVVGPAHHGAPAPPHARHRPARPGGARGPDRRGLVQGDGPRRSRRGHLQPRPPARSRVAPGGLGARPALRALRQLEPRARHAEARGPHRGRREGRGRPPRPDGRHPRGHAPRRERREGGLPEGARARPGLPARGPRAEGHRRAGPRSRLVPRDAPRRGPVRDRSRREDPPLHRGRPPPPGGEGRSRRRGEVLRGGAEARPGPPRGGPPARRHLHPGPALGGRRARPRRVRRGDPGLRRREGAVPAVLPAGLRRREARQAGEGARVPPARVRPRLDLPARARGPRPPPRAGGAVGRGAPDLHDHHHPPPGRPHRPRGGRDALADRRDLRQARPAGPRGRRLPEGPRDRREPRAVPQEPREGPRDPRRLGGRGRAAPAAPAAPGGPGEVRELRRPRRGLPRPAPRPVPGHRRLPRRLARGSDLAPGHPGAARPLQGDAPGPEGGRRARAAPRAARGPGRPAERGADAPLARRDPAHRGEGRAGRARRAREGARREPAPRAGVRAGRGDPRRPEPLGGARAGLRADDRAAPEDARRRARPRRPVARPRRPLPQRAPQRGGRPHRVPGRGALRAGGRRGARDLRRARDREAGRGGRGDRRLPPAPQARRDAEQGRLRAREAPRPAQGVRPRVLRRAGARAPRRRRDAGGGPGRLPPAQVRARPGEPLDGRRDVGPREARAREGAARGHPHAARGPRPRHVRAEGEGPRHQPEAGRDRRPGVDAVLREHVQVRGAHARHEGPEALPPRGAPEPAAAPPDRAHRRGGGGGRLRGAAEEGALVRAREGDDLRAPGDAARPAHAPRAARPRVPGGVLGGDLAVRRHRRPAPRREAEAGARPDAAGEGPQERPEGARPELLRRPAPGRRAGLPRRRRADLQPGGDAARRGPRAREAGRPLREAPGLEAAGGHAGQGSPVVLPHRHLRDPPRSSRALVRRNHLRRRDASAAGAGAR
ncbi:MAG: tetratricopeptide repeat protein [Anaeromyxobacteraceae bacterium]